MSLKEVTGKTKIFALLELQIFWPKKKRRQIQKNASKWNNFREKIFMGSASLHHPGQVFMGAELFTGIILMRKNNIPPKKEFWLHNTSPFPWQPIICIE